MSDILTREEQRDIAIKALKQLKIYNPYIEKFKEDGTVTLFQQYAGFYVDETQNQDVLKIIKDFEAETGSLVYAITEEYFVFGRCYTMLCVSKYKDDAKFTIDKTMRPDTLAVFAWVHNYDEPAFSEYGTVCVRTAGGGIRRVE